MAPDIIGVDYGRGDSFTIWQCAECHAAYSDADQLRAHIWHAHARNIAEAWPAMLVSLADKAERWARLRTQMGFKP